MWIPNQIPITEPAPGTFNAPLMRYGLELGADILVPLVPTVTSYHQLAVQTGADTYAHGIHIAMLQSGVGILPWDVNQLLADEEQIVQIRSTLAFHTGENLIKEWVSFYAFIGIKENLEACYRVKCESLGGLVRGAERILLGRRNNY